MLDLKMITQAQYEAEVAGTLAVKNRKSLHTDSYAIDMIRQQVNDMVGKDRAIADGYQIYTTIDADLQKKAEESLRAHLPRWRRTRVTSTRLTRSITVLLQQRRQSGDADDKEAARRRIICRARWWCWIMPTAASSRSSAGAISRRANMTARSRLAPAGTAFKPFVYAAAFEKGFFPGTLGAGRGHG